ncbi:MAG: Fe-S cluster assembly ATPase SufC [Proteobacteria bacterium]|nr:Fe-S cluster assembly ATPase SufC [Pseudomonadota bacterium]
MLEISGLQAAIGEQPILRGIDLKIGPGEVHAIMGPNGSGKTTLAQVLAGREDYDVTGGSVTFAGRDLLALNVEQRAREGLFLAFQYPVALPGVTSSYFLRTAVNAVRAHRGQDELSGKAFLELCRQRMELLQMKPELLQRAVNDGFSGGEKKRHEILQLALLEPRLALLDETDSGLDIDALQTVARGVNALRDAQRSFLMITHYQRLLDYIVPDYVHVLVGGRIVKSGDKELALHLEEHGYGWIVAPETATPAAAAARA